MKKTLNLACLDDALAPGCLPGNASWPQAQEIGRLAFLPVF